MPTFGRLSWTERLDEIQRRLAEEIGTPTSPGLDVPYYSRSLDIEPLLVEVSNAALRELSVQDIGSPLAVTTASGASPVSMPVTAIRLVTATLDNAPGVEVEVARMVQNTNSPSKLFCIQKSLTGNTRVILHNATTASFSFLCEQALAVWQSTNLLPPAYDEKTIAETVRILSIADNVEF